MRNSWKVMCVFVLGITLTGGLFAQEAEEAEEQPVAAEAAEPAAARIMEEMIVTAQKREELAYLRTAVGGRCGRFVRKSADSRARLRRFFALNDSHNLV